jgi:hypothetical protein
MYINSSPEPIRTENNTSTTNTNPRLLNTISTAINHTPTSRVSDARNFHLLSCIYTNPTSLVNKWDEFKVLIAAHNAPHVNGISETWFNEKSLSTLNGYTLYRRDREAVRGGGVALYINNSITSSECHDFTSLSVNSEQVWCVVNINKDSILIGCIYKPPFCALSALHEINQSVAKAKELVELGKYTSLLIVGDFNYPDIDWSSSDGGVSKHRICRPSTKDFLEVISSCFLTQHVMEPTFMSSNNTLDLVLTDDPSRVCDLRVEPPLGHTDKGALHSLLAWNYRVTGDPKQLSAPKRLYAKGDYKSFMS